MSDQKDLKAFYKTKAQLYAVLVPVSVLVVFMETLTYRDDIVQKTLLETYYNMIMWGPFVLAVSSAVLFLIASQKRPLSKADTYFLRVLFIVPMLWLLVPVVLMVHLGEF